MYQSILLRDDYVCFLWQIILFSIRNPKNMYIYNMWSGRWKCSIFLDSRFFCFTTWRFLVSSSTIITLPSIQYNHQVLYAILDVSKILFQRIGHWKKAPSKSTASTSAENHINTSLILLVDISRCSSALFKLSGAKFYIWSLAFP